MNTVRTYIVEDNATIRENLVGTLREVARVETVGEAETEDEGTAWLTHNRGKWDLAIIDLFLKEGSGMNVIEACRDRSSTQRLVVLSNHTTRHVRQRCAELGADAVFDKATEIDDLIDFCLRQRQEQTNHH
ncbi:MULTISPECIES: response regulator [unclassified Variovorax]|jgi:two-component system OmpR family response regulator|uniref:response regulator n=1 Tax=unclassified Variovorax TaxID=663243 RepID=UPI00198CC304|nr:MULTISPECIES: response regulator [unclassified Variovorax]MBC7391785.1 response regulator [Variovorax sp.]MEB0058393.1 response regulator [Variovorax sp. LG9.2]MEB0111837.1 response regulator [Variovorax sp. RTB1]